MLDDGVSERVSCESIWAEVYAVLSGSDPSEPGAAPWTRAIKSALVNPYRGHVSATFMASGMNNANGGQRKWEREYLVDVAVSADVLGEEASDLGYRCLLLAAEIEWNPKDHELDYDFAKLADVRADRKVFVSSVVSVDPVGGASDAETCPEVVRRFARFLSRHELVPRGEEYLVLLTAEGQGEHEECCAAWVITKALDPTLIVKLRDPTTES